MIVLCCGSRHAKADAYKNVVTALDLLPFAASGILTGGALGYDNLCELWAKSKGIATISMDANWSFYKDPAGSIRNGWMLDLITVQYCVAFPGGNGTLDMVQKATAKGIPVWQPIQQ